MTLHAPHKHKSSAWPITSPPT